jgi:hypothetical protein
VTVASAAAALVTPYHIGLYASIMQHGGHTTVDDITGEFVSLQFRQLADWIVLGLTLFAVALTARQIRHQTFTVLLLTVTSFVSLRLSRDAWVLVVPATAIVSAPWFVTAAEQPASRLRRRHVGMIALVVAAVVGFSTVPLRSAQTRWDDAVSARFPVAAARVIAGAGAAGPVYSPPEWGGYLLWSLPGLSVEIDGRTDLHGAARIRRSAATWMGRRNWAADPDLEGAAIVVAPVETSLPALLLGDPRFSVLYNDAVAVVFVRRRSADGQQYVVAGHLSPAEGTE